MKDPQQQQQQLRKSIRLVVTDGTKCSLLFTDYGRTDGRKRYASCLAYELHETTTFPFSFDPFISSTSPTNFLRRRRSGMLHPEKPGPPARKRLRRATQHHLGQPEATIPRSPLVPLASTISSSTPGQNRLPQPSLLSVQEAW